jgi:prophage regulatory protein
MVGRSNCFWDNKTTMNQPLRVLRINQVISRVGLSRSTIYELVSQGRFPPPAKLGLRAVGWSSEAIDGWIAARLGVQSKSA